MNRTFPEKPSGAPLAIEGAKGMLERLSNSCRMILDTKGIAPGFPRNAQHPAAMPIEPRPPWRWVYRVWPLAELPRYPRCARTICFHEAGHAVLAAELRLPMTAAEVHANGSGKVGLDLPAPSDTDVDIPRDRLQVAATEVAALFVAGVMAELLLHGVDVKGSVLWLSTSDWEKAEMMLRHWFGHNSPPMGYAQRLAVAVLTERWAEVRAVAAALEQRGTLSAADIAVLLCAPGRTAAAEASGGSEVSL